MEKVRVAICVGTACYVLGGAETIGRIEELRELFGDAVTWEGEPCMHCLRDRSKPVRLLASRTSTP